ncbi:hypothetical protein ENBRE01_1529 [Enteropsectra breve]|nr:hypothetical protein ENBRE01_1529 [Enteropsectra breve]
MDVKGDDLLLFRVGVCAVFCLLIFSALIIYFVYEYYAENPLNQNYLQNISSFILSNKEVKSALLGKEFMCKSYTNALKMMIKIVDGSMKYKDLKKHERDAINVLDSFLAKKSDYHSLERKLQTLLIILETEKSSEFKYDNPFKNMFTRVTGNALCFNTKRKLEINDENICLNICANPSVYDETGKVDLCMLTLFQTSHCAQCQGAAHPERVTFTGMTAKSHFILKLHLDSVYKDKTAQFETTYFIQDPNGRKILPNKYAVESVLYIKDIKNIKYNESKIECIQNNGHPMVFHNVEPDAIYYLMMREILPGTE